MHTKTDSISSDRDRAETDLAKCFLCCKVKPRSAFSKWHGKTSVVCGKCRKQQEKARRRRQEQRLAEETSRLEEAERQIIIAVADAVLDLPEDYRTDVGDKLRELAFMVDGKG